MKTAFEYEAELAALRGTLSGADAVIGFLRFKDARRRKVNTELRQRLADCEQRNGGVSNG